MYHATPDRRLPAIAVTLVALLPTVTDAAVVIKEVTVDGRRLPSGPPTSRAEGHAVHVPSTARRVAFHFADTMAAERVDSEAEAWPRSPRATRLRYRLDGHDDAWRDPPASGRLMLNIDNADGRSIAGNEAPLRGETPGWTGVVETSPFVSHSLTATAPAGSASVSLNIISHNADQVVGVIGIDNLVATISRPGEPVRERIELPLQVDEFAVTALPRHWGKTGTARLASQLRIRPVPEPHPILVLADEDPHRYAGWTLRKVPVQPVQAGDRMTVSWSCAHSLGIGDEAVASYETLPPGTYRFRVVAALPDGQPTASETSLTIEVYVPWHLRRDLWAAAAAAGLAGIVTAGRAANVRRMKRRLAEMERERQLEQERARIARDLHDDVGAGLTEIAVQTDWLRRDLERLHDAEMTDRAERVCQSAVELIRSVDAIVWAVNPKNDALDRFLGYLTQSTDQFVRAAGLGIRLDVPDEVPALPLSGRVRHDLFLIVREAVNNAVKHAEATLVHLGARIDGGTVTITVEDDGRGFDPALTADDGRHSGLANMRRRADDIGGTLTLGSRPGGGTRVAITAPLAGSPA